MKQLSYGLIILTIIVFTLPSCKRDKGLTPEMGYNYFPDQVGKYVVYDVDSFYYNDFYKPLKIDTFKFQIKEKIESIFPDNQNRPTIRLERYVRYHSDTVAYSAMPWTLRNVWTENKTATTAEKIENNVRFIKLSFPVNETQTWNGNVQNTGTELFLNDPSSLMTTMNYSYDYFDVPKKIGTFSFDSVLQVTQYDDKSAFLTQRAFYQERYARNVGLVYKRVIAVKSQPDPDWDLPSHTQQWRDSVKQYFFSLPILNRVTSGMQYSWTVNSFGVE